jgi:DNA-binding transcriptional ArsR family regulator
MDATTFAALGEPSRLQIVELLRHRPFSVGDIAERLGIRQPQVSKHLRGLSEAGLVEVEPVARRRIYHLREEPFEEIGDWGDRRLGRVVRNPVGGASGFARDLPRPVGGSEGAGGAMRRTSLG